MKHTLVPSEEVDLVWNDVKDLVKKTNDSILNEHDVYQLLKDGSYTLWLITDDNNKIVTAITMTILKYPRDYACKIVTCGGSRINEWLEEFLEKAEIIAKEHGCSYLDIDGRAGWSKLLKDFTVDYYTLRKRI